MSRKLNKLSEWNEFDRVKRDMVFIAHRLRELGSDDNEIIELFNGTYVKPELPSFPKRKGLLVELEWYLNHSKENWDIIPLYEGASWMKGKKLGNTPDFLVAGEYPKGNKKGIFFVEVKSSRETMENDRRKIERMQQRISRISEVSGHNIPLFVFFKENGKWRMAIS
jgi:hypothetical protein